MNTGLDALAAEINARLALTAKKSSKSDDYRLAAGLLLAQARERVLSGEAGKITWNGWIAANIRRSAGDIRKLIKRANQDNSPSSHLPLRSREIMARGPHFHLPRSRMIERSGDEIRVLHELALRASTLRELARSAKEAYDITAAINKVILPRGLSSDDCRHLDTAIAVANAATDVARDAVRSFVRSTARQSLPPKGSRMPALDETDRKALPDRALSVARTPVARSSKKGSRMLALASPARIAVMAETDGADHPNPPRA